MKEELDKKLCEQYPDIFRDRNADMRDTCMCWGFPGDGWYELLDECCKKLTMIKKTTGIGIVATQVKEKFGTLRFYYCGNPDTELKEGITEEEGKLWGDIISDTIRTAERTSGRTCELCGKYGTDDGGAAEHKFTIKAKRVHAKMYTAYIDKETVFSPSMISNLDTADGKFTDLGYMIQVVHNPEDSKNFDTVTGFHLTAVMPIDGSEEDEFLEFEVTVTGRGWIMTLCDAHKEIRRRLNAAGLGFAVYGGKLQEYADSNLDRFIDVLTRIQGLAIPGDEALQMDEEELREVIKDCKELKIVCKQKEIPGYIAQQLRTRVEVDEFERLMKLGRKMNLEPSEVYHHRLDNEQKMADFAEKRDKAAAVIQYAEDKGIDKVTARFKNFKTTEEVDEYLVAEAEAKADAAKEDKLERAAQEGSDQEDNDA